MELREQIIDTAADLFNQKGLWFTLDDICEKMHISKKTIYVCFSCKEDLLLEMTDKVFASIYEQKRNIIAEQIPFEAKLRKMFIGLPDEYLNTDFRKLEGVKEKYPKVYDRIQHYLEAGWEPVIELLRQGQAEGRCNEVSLPVLKTIVSSTIRSFINDGSLEENGINYTDALNSMVEIIIKGISKENN